MKTEIIRLNEENRAQAIALAAKSLKMGALVAFPTDTVYGLGAIYSDNDAIESIFRAKGRDDKKPLSILISDEEQAYELASEIPRDARRLMKSFWPGALTIILKKAEGIADRVTAGRDTVGIRMPDSDITRELIRAAGHPLAAPSANLSGKRSAVCAKDVIEDLSGRIDMILDGGLCPGGISSTIVDMTGDKPVILREGGITADMLK